MPYGNGLTGFYAGINGGYGLVLELSALGRASTSMAACSAARSATTGKFGRCSSMASRPDADWTDLRGTSNVLGCSLTICRTRNDFLATARGRLGYAIDRWMFYVDRGLAVGDIRTTTPNFSGVDQTNAGWTIGGGVEFAIVGNWIGKSRVPPRRFCDTANCGTGCGYLAVGNNVSLTTNVVRGGINYRF